MARDWREYEIRGLKMEPLVGIEPTTYSLRMNCSTPELQRRLTERSGRKQSCRQPASRKSGERGMSRKLSAFRLEIFDDGGGEAGDVVFRGFESGLHAFFAERVAGDRADAGCATAFGPIETEGEEVVHG